MRTLKLSIFSAVFLSLCFPMKAHSVIDFENYTPTLDKEGLETPSSYLLTYKKHLKHKQTFLQQKKSMENGKLFTINMTSKSKMA